MTVASLNPATRADAPPAVRRITAADIRSVLNRGVDDFLAIPTQLAFLCLLYPVVGLVAARAATGSDLLPLLFPLVAGMALLGPVLAVGIYELSRRREAGLSVSWIHAFDVLRSPSLGGIAVLGGVLLAVFTLWLITARVLFDVLMGGAEPGSMGSLLQMVMDTGAGWTLIVVGNAVGLVFAAAVLVLTAVSVPLVLDRNVSPLVAMATSIRAARLNPVPMALWGLTVACALLLGSIPLFVGLAVAMPVLGHATWHLYRRVVV